MSGPRQQDRKIVGINEIGLCYKKKGNRKWSNVYAAQQHSPPTPILFLHPLVPKFPTAQLIAKYILKYVKKFMLWGRFYSSFCLFGMSSSAMLSR